MIGTENRHEIPVEQGTLAAREFTGGDGAPLVILHGGPGTPSVYLESLSDLSVDRTVVLYDQIGCGASSVPDNDFQWDVASFVNHLESVRQFFDYERMHLYGHSWGGFLALAYTEAHPKRVRTLTLGSPLVDVQRWSDDASALVGELPSFDQEAIMSGPGSPEYSRAEAKFYRRHFCRLDPYPSELIQAMDGQDMRSYEAMWGPNEFTQTGSLRGLSQAGVAADLEIPNLWLTGEADEARPSTLIDFAESNRHGRLRIFANATHCAHLEVPQEYRATIRTFLLANE